ncbi:MAG: MurR/RpiR family transcriptional regulator [Tissierellales bacterium]|nr:MurR/RpiR family transcriptional regulator [Tissierellales bacterium]
MEQNIISKIQDSFMNFSKAQKIIAEYIVNNYDKAAFMTAAAIGNRLNVSESTVVRFANALGYKGYKDLQRDLQELIRNKLTTVQRISLSDELNTNSDFIDKIMAKDIDNMKKTILEINEFNFNLAVNTLIEADNIYLLGLRSSSFLAGYLNFYLNFIFDNTKLVQPSANDIFEQLAKIKSDDVLVCITYPRYSKRTLDALDYVRTKGCKIVTFTDSNLSPAYTKSDISLIAKSEMLSFVDSLVSPMSLLNAFILAIATKKRDDITPFFEELEFIWEKYGTYNESNTSNIK